MERVRKPQPFENQNSIKRHRESLRRFFCFIRGQTMAINQYKDGEGVNDHKKGNRTKTGRNPAPAIEINKQIGEDIASYKEIAERVRQNKKNNANLLLNDTPMETVIASSSFTAALICSAISIGASGEWVTSSQHSSIPNGSISSV